MCFTNWTNFPPYDKFNAKNVEDGIKRLCKSTYKKM